MSARSDRLRIEDVTPSLVAVSGRGFRRVTSLFVLLVLLCWPTQESFGAENLECPEIGAASVPDLIGDTSGGGLFVSENRIDLANEINEAINRLQITSPNISWTEVQNVLVAAYCRVVARTGDLLPPRNGAACASSTMSWSSRSQRTRCRRER